jgi:ketosteroid isomerase-like protein
VARSYFDAFGTGDPALIASHVSEDFSNEHTAALGSGCQGRDAYLERLPGFLADMAGLRYSIDHLVVDGSSVAVFYTMTARWQGTTPIEVQGAQRLEIVNGQIVRRVDYWDSKVFLDQLEE